MAGEFKAIVNVRITQDMNVSFQTSHLGVEDETAAYAAGASDALLALAYVNGYASVYPSEEQSQ